MLGILSIVVIIDYYADPNYIIHGSALLYLYYYVSIIGVVFATGTHAFALLLFCTCRLTDGRYQYGAKAVFISSRRLLNNRINLTPALGYVVLSLEKGVFLRLGPSRLCRRLAITQAKRIIAYVYL